MTDLVEIERWENGIYQLETSDPVMGGPDGIDNLQAKQLANRTRYLKKAIEASQSSFDEHVEATDPHPQYATHGELAEKVAALVAQAPGTLDTLSKLAKALDNDPNFASKVASALASKAALDSPPFVGTPTTPTPPMGDSGSVVVNAAWVRGQNYQPALGFTPVQQGGGTNQGANKVKIGWNLDGSGLRCMVDATDLGNFVFDSAVIGQIVFEPRTQARAGYLKCNGALIKRADYPKLWAYAQASHLRPDRTVTDRSGLDLRRLEQSYGLRCIVPAIDDQFVALDALAATDGILNRYGLDVEPVKYPPNVGVIVQTHYRAAFQRAQ